MQLSSLHGYNTYTHGHCERAGLLCLLFRPLVSFLKKMVTVVFLFKEIFVTSSSNCYRLCVTFPESAEETMYAVAELLTEWPAS